MAKSDSSAVQKLIELAQQKPLELDADLEGLFADDAKARPAARGALPPPRRGANASMQPSAALPPLPRTRAPVSTHTGFQAPPPPTPTSPRIAAPVYAPSTEPVDLADLALRDDSIPDTQATPRRGSIMPWILAGAFALGVGFAGVYIVAVGLERTAPPPDTAVASAVPAPAAAPAAAPTQQAAVAPVEAAAVAPTPAPSEAQVAAPAVAPAAAAPVTVSFFSQPAGASVILVENGSMTPLGRTPLTAPLLAGKTHELLFTLEGRATVLAHIDPATKTEVSVELAAGAAGAVVAQPAPVAVPAVAAPAPVSEARTERKPEKADKTDKREVKRERKESPPKEAKRVAAAPAGKGTLMLGAKPPCDIIIDGKATGLTTPQREIPLSAGKHTITLVNAQHGIRKAFAVTVPTGDTVKVVKDFTDLMK